MSDILIKHVKINSRLAFTLSNIKTGYLLKLLRVAYTEIQKSIECLYHWKYMPLRAFIKQNGGSICREFSFASCFANSFFLAPLLLFLRNWRLWRLTAEALNYYTFIYWNIQYVCLEAFKVVSCRFVVCRQRMESISFHFNRYLINLDRDRMWL